MIADTLATVTIVVGTLAAYTLLYNAYARRKKP